MPGRALHARLLATAGEKVAFVLPSEAAVMPFHVACVGAALLWMEMAATKRTPSKRVVAVMIVGVNATAAVFGQLLSVLRDWCSLTLLLDLGLW
jgi:hypothetical protein